jgi:L1 cell adhesion molecule
VCSESCPCDRVGDDCNYLAYSEDTGQCLKFTPPPKVCRGVELIGPILHKGNINNFVDCEVVQGSIHIDHLSFTNDTLNGIQALTAADLQSLSHVTEIDGYLAVTNTTQIDNLQFLENLHAIRGRFTPFGGRHSLYVVGNSNLSSLRTTSLKRIDRGDVKITDNEQLCFVDTVNWTQIALRPLTNGANGIEVINNQNRTICDEQGNTCDIECNGCWFTGPTDCVSCRNHEFQGTCVSECNLQMDGFCGPCDDVCDKFCNGPTGFNCTSDGPPGSECKYFIEGEQCVRDCSVGRYAVNHTCLACPSICHIDKALTGGDPIGCSGPSFFQRPGGCDRCEKIGDVNSVSIYY